MTPVLHIYIKLKFEHFSLPTCKICSNMEDLFDKNVYFKKLTNKVHQLEYHPLLITLLLNPLVRNQGVCISNRHLQRA